MDHALACRAHLPQIEPQQIPLDLTEHAGAITHGAHSGQTDKSGLDYIEQLRRVAERAALIAPADLRIECIAAAWPHDVVEDTDITFEDLRAEGFPQLIFEAADRLTKKPHVARSDYFAAIRAHAVARIVKTADLIDNTDPERVALLDNTTRSRLAEKYAESWALLLGDA